MEVVPGPEVVGDPEPEPGWDRAAERGQIFPDGDIVGQVDVPVAPEQVGPAARVAAQVVDGVHPAADNAAPGIDGEGASGHPGEQYEFPVRAAEQGVEERATWLPFGAAAKPSRLRPRKKNSPSIPHVWSQSSHTPPVNRNPLRKPPFTRCPPKSTAAARFPGTPPGACAMPGGAVVASGGSDWPEAAQ